jgi:hypothetical protein
MIDFTPIEWHVRAGEVLDPEAALVIRGWPPTVDGLLRNADATRRRYSRAGRPFVAVSAEVTVAGWDLDAILSGPRLRTRRSYAAVSVGRIVETGFGLLPRSVRPTTAWSFPRTLRR